MSKKITLNNKEYEIENYYNFHQKRIEYTLGRMLDSNVKNVVELGGHPWAMTSAIIDNPAFNLLATISAEEITQWTDEIPLARNIYSMVNINNLEHEFYNYSVNIERTLFNIEEKVDCAIACEIIEHCKRSPHTMLLNINNWLPVGGKLIITTPNGTQFENPFSTKTKTPAYRCNMYERHSYAFTLKGLSELIELCGFHIVEADILNLYEMNGIGHVRRLLSDIPSGYFKEKFRKSLFILAEKKKDVSRLEKMPSVYVYSKDWEYINS